MFRFSPHTKNAPKHWNAEQVEQVAGLSHDDVDPLRQCDRVDANWSIQAIDKRLGEVLHTHLVT
jgi:hypothetical protein